jgi:flagellar protein FliO/FliZ
MSSLPTSGCVASTDERRATRRGLISQRLSRARVRASAFSILSFLAVPHAALAGATTPPDTSLPTTGFLQVLVALGLVLAAIAAFAWFLRRLTPGAIGSRGWLRVVGGAMVGPKERVVLIEVGDTWLLLGVAASNVSLLHTLPKPPQSAAKEGEVVPSGFSSALFEALGRRKKG